MCVCVRAGGRAGVRAGGRAGVRSCVPACVCVCVCIFRFHVYILHTVPRNLIYIILL